MSLCDYDCEPLYLCDGQDMCCRERVCYQNGGPCKCTVNADHGVFAIQGAGIKFAKDGSFEITLVKEEA